MRTLTAWSILVLTPVTIMFAAGCRDEVAVTLDEIEAVQQEIQALLDQRAQYAAAWAVEDLSGSGSRRDGPRRN